MYGAPDVWSAGYMGRGMYGAHDICGAQDEWSAGYMGIGCMERRFVGRWMYGALVNRALDERSAGYKGPRM